MAVTHLLYLHGFRSSPQSAKARQVAARVARRHPKITWWCPQLPPSPKEAMDMVMQGIAAWPKPHMAVMGSSLGGFYATCVAEAIGCKAVLLNPAVHPARDLAKYIGEQTGTIPASISSSNRISWTNCAHLKPGSSPARRTTSRSSPRATRCWIGGR